MSEAYREKRAINDSNIVTHNARELVNKLGYEKALKITRRKVEEAPDNLKGMGRSIVEEIKRIEKEKKEDE